MIKRSAKSFCLAFCVLISISANAATWIDTNSFLEAMPEKDPTVLQLNCRYDDRRFYQSRLALIRTHDARFDYGLSSGHGVLIKGLDFAKDCIVKDYKGRKYALNALYVPNDITPGGERDWAIIRLEKISDPDIVRFSLPEFSKDASVAFRRTIRDINFPKARGIGYNTQLCHSMPADHAGLEFGNILAHDCRAISGQSGSPISVSLEDAPVLVGLHLGTGFIIRSKYTGKAERLGYFRFIDEQMLAEINTIITRYFN